jgi:hypothetical protein
MIDMTFTTADDDIASFNTDIAGCSDIILIVTSPSASYIAISYQQLDITCTAK